MQATQDWKRVSRFSQLKVGDTVRFISHPNTKGVFRGDGHGSAIVYVSDTTVGFVGAPRDCLTRLHELEVLADPTPGQIEAATAVLRRCLDQPTRKPKEATNV